MLLRSTNDPFLECEAEGFPNKEVGGLGVESETGKMNGRSQSVTVFMIVDFWTPPELYLGESSSFRHLLGYATFENPAFLHWCIFWLMLRLKSVEKPCVLAPFRKVLNNPAFWHGFLVMSCFQVLRSVLTKTGIGIKKKNNKHQKEK